MCQFAFFRAVLGVVVLCLGISVLRADVLSSAFSPTAIPDGQPSGIVLTIGSAPEIASIDRLTVSVSHEWLGDLTVRILPPAGESFTLFDRLAVTASEPDGSSAALGTFVFKNNIGVLTPEPYQFAQNGADFAAAAEEAAATNPTFLLPADEVYGAQTWESGPFPAGTWKVFVSDSAELSNGMIDSVRIGYTAVVPEPGMTALFGLALLTGVARLCIRKKERRKVRKDLG